jgi:tryptophan synthase alpha chain
MDLIFLLAPTSTEARIERIVKLASGYIYYVSLRGVTGASHLDVADVAAHLAAIRRKTSLPVGVGFGIRDAETARAIGAVADAVVIGSRLIQVMEEAPAGAAIERASAFLAGIRQALDGTGQVAARATQ